MEILRRDRALVRVGRKLALNTPECRALCCEGGCPFWYELTECTAPGCGDSSPPERRIVYICSTVPCVNGEPISISTTLFFDNSCWSVGNSVLELPPDAFFYSSSDPVQCIDNGCENELCPQGVGYLLAVPCQDGQPNVYVCNYSGNCGLVWIGQYAQCYRINPATGYIPYFDLPPGALLFNGTGLVAQQGRCGCIESPDASCQQGVYDSGGICGNPPATSPCCCKTDQNGVALGRPRVTALSLTTRTTYPGGFDNSTSTITNESRDANGNFLYIIHTVRDSTTGGHEEYDRFGGLTNTCGFRHSDLAQFVMGAAGLGVVIYCPQNTPPDTTVIELTSTCSCDSATFRQEYVQTGQFGDVTRVTGSGSAEMVGGQLCCHGCSGALQSRGNADRVRVGCSGCGKNQLGERIV